MFAPDIRYNETKGVFPNLRLFAYPTPTRRYHVAIGKSTTKDENYEIDFEDRGLLGGAAFLEGAVSYERDSTERFWGFGNDSDEDAESNYTSANFLADILPGYWVLPSAHVSYRMRIRRFEVQSGQVDDIPFIATEHPEVRTRGLDTAVYWQHRLALTYDTRDSLDMPTRGAFGTLYVDGADRHVGSATSFVAFGIEGKAFVPFRGERRNPILALRGQLDWLEGGTDTPFWLQNSLGGRRRLRGFGGDRFIDFNRSLVGAELRTRVYERKLFGVKAELELAPFVETGQVFRHLDDSPVDDLHWVGGLGFRFLVRPQVVAFVDVGYGGEGSSVFTGIDYPF
jgi:outer membrane protein assembly factor BamA